MVPSGDALPHRADEENRPLTTRTPRTNPQLLPGSEAAFQRRRRGPEQQSQSHHEKILRIPHLPCTRTRPLSLTWQAARAGIHPRFLLRSRNSLAWFFDPHLEQNDREMAEIEGWNLG